MSKSKKLNVQGNEITIIENKGKRIYFSYQYAKSQRW